MIDSTGRRWTTAELVALPYDEWNIYEIISGELCISDRPPVSHQLVVGSCLYALTRWDREARLGRALPWPGVIFSEFDSVVPDVAWLSRDRWAGIVNEDGHFCGAPS